MLKFSCEKCGAAYSVADEAAGKSTKCPKCGATMRVPSADVSAGAGEMSAAPVVPAAPADPMAALQAALSAVTPSRGLADKPAPSADKPSAGPKPAVPAPVAPAPVAATPPAPVPQPAAPAPVVPAPVAQPPVVAPPPAPVAPAPAPQPQPAAPAPVAQAPGEPVWQEAIPVDVPGEPVWQDVVPIEASPAEQQIPDDGIPLARPAEKSKLWLFIAIGVAAAVLLAAGAGVILFFPASYDIEQLKASFQEAKTQAAKALPEGTESFDGLDEKVMVDGIAALKVAVAKFKSLDQEFSKLEQYQSGDSTLRELASATDLAVLTEGRRLKELESELWPRPGGVGDMYDRMKASVPLIESMRVVGRGKAMSIASGFLIKPEGLGYLLVTNRHVVQDGGDGFTVRFLTEGKRSTDKSDDIKLKPSDVMHIHRHEDLAVLSFPEDTWPTIERLKVHPLAIAKELKVGRPVWAVGNPGAGAEGILLQALVKGDVSAIVNDEADEPVLFRFTAPVNKGNSGGPVLDSAGRVVGIVSRGIMSKNAMNFAVHYHELDELTDLMAGRRKDANLVSLDTREIGLIVDPLRNLPPELDPVVEKWSKTGFQRVQWLGRDSNSYFVLPLQGAKPTVVRKFKATKGNTYSILTVSGRISAVEISVKAPGVKKPVYIRSGDGTSKAKVAKEEEFREDFVAEKDGTFEVRFVRSRRLEEIKGSVPQDIAVCACVVEQKALEWRGDESSE